MNWHLPLLPRSVPPPWRPPVPDRYPNTSPMPVPMPTPERTERRRISPAMLLSLPLLSQLSADQARWLATRVVVRHCPRGEAVVEQDQPANALYFLLNGAAQAVRQGPNGRTLVADLLVPGDLFGETGLIDGAPHSATVRSVVSSDFLVLARADLAQCMDRSPVLRDALLKVVVARLRQRIRRIRLLALNDVRGRVLQMLLDQSQPYDGGRLVRQPVGRQTMADMVGASREMVSRVMMELAKSGVLTFLPDGAVQLHVIATD